MGSVRISHLVLGTAFILLAFILWATSDALFAAHTNGLIYYFSSDGGEYFRLYDMLYADVELLDSPTLFMVGSPILMLKLAEGNLWIVQLVNLTVMACTLWTAVDCLPDFRSRIRFVIGTLLFPYFLFGFLALNKEVYAMSSAIMLCVYYSAGKRRHLFLALLLGGIARYYMLLSILFVIVAVPRAKPVRYWVVIGAALAISFLGPIVKSLIPSYSKDEVLDVAGLTGVIFTAMIDHGAYFIAYPIKYLFLLPQRLYSWFIDPTRKSNTMEACVSLITMFVMFRIALLVPSRRFRSSPLFRYIVIGAIAPLPMMWSDIMHWRYFSFVYFFYLFALVQYRTVSPKAEPNDGLKT
ncbi:hypothetical protein [Massilia sp. CT11-137]|uniref:hypothetical protein n=1 Tax=Massilia sp. CT11-137 TaxID=3393901 RepID=UPI0039A771B3